MRVDSHWSEKKREDMTERDWRIFRWVLFIHTHTHCTRLRVGEGMTERVWRIFRWVLFIHTHTAQG